MAPDLTPIVVEKLRYQKIIPHHWDGASIQCSLHKFLHTHARGCSTPADLSQQKNIVAFFTSFSSFAVEKKYIPLREGKPVEGKEKKQIAPHQRVGNHIELVCVMICERNHREPHIRKVEKSKCLPTPTASVVKNHNLKALNAYVLGA